MRQLVIPSPALAAILVLSAAGAAAAPALPALGTSNDGLSVSGLSSGAYMAVQFQVAYSSLVRGAGIIAGGPYFCAENRVDRALANCMEAPAGAAPPTTDETLKTIEQLAGAGKIDPVSALRDDRVWLFSGGQDKTVAASVMDALEAFYRKILPPDAIRHVRLADAGHAMPSVAAARPNACGTSASPYINRCGDFDAAGQLLAHLDGPLKPSTSAADGDLVAFDQRPFIKGAASDASLADDGYAFIPKACRGGGCRVHVAFHGCQQNAEQIGRRFVEGAGYNHWAASNRLVILYPQTTSRYGLAFGSLKWVMNPKACWDWWGYTGADYHTRDGVQMRAVRAMIDRLSLLLPESPPLRPFSPEGGTQN
jgi:poly(3-hydroxybutyrate) depolymerase